MQKPKRPRLNPLLLLALLATVAAVIFAPDPEKNPDTVAPVSRKVRSLPSDPPGIPQQAAVVSEQDATVGSVRVDMAGRIVDIFAVPRTSVPKGTAATPPPAPVMPAFNYKYMGRIVDQGEQSLFFTRAGRPYMVKPGDTLDGNFLFESVSGKAAVFVYVPLSMKTTVVLGE